MISGHFRRASKADDAKNWRCKFSPPPDDGGGGDDGPALPLPAPRRRPRPGEAEGGGQGGGGGGLRQGDGEQGLELVFGGEKIRGCWQLLGAC